MLRADDIFSCIEREHSSWARSRYKLQGGYSCHSQLQLALHTHGVRICGFHQPWIENIQKKKKNPRRSKKQNLNLACAEHNTESTGMKWYVGIPCYSVYADIGCTQILRHFIYGTWTATDFGIRGRSWNHCPEESEGLAYLLVVEAGIAPRATWITGMLSCRVPVGKWEPEPCEWILLRWRHQQVMLMRWPHSFFCFLKFCFPTGCHLESNWWTNSY